VISSNMDEYDPKTYKLPSPQITGPTYSDKDVASPKSKSTKSTTEPKKEEIKSTATNKCPLIATLKHDVDIDQSWARDDQFDNTVFSTYHLLNKSDGKLAITKVTGQYMDKSGKWVDIDTKLCTRNQRYYYSSFGNNSFNMDPMQQWEISVAHPFVIQSQQAEKNRRLHKSLPQPLKLKTVFEDAQGGKCEIIIEAVNPPLELVSRSEKETSAGKPFEKWLQCDDTDLEIRLWTSVAIPDDQTRVEIQLMSRGKYLYISELRKLAYQAVKEKKSEIELDVSLEEKTGKIKQYALIDLKNQRTYGVKFVLTTTTSSVTDYYLLPILKSARD